MNSNAPPDYRRMLCRMYDETLAGNFQCVATVFHPEYRSMTEAGEDSPAAYIAGTQRMLADYEILHREVVLTFGDASHVGVLHRVRFRPRGSMHEPTEQLRVDIYQIENGQFFRHWGVPPF